MITSNLLNKNIVRSDLEAAADKVFATDRYAAERLRELAKAVDGGSYSDAWAANDIHKIVDIDDIVKRYQLQNRVDIIASVVEFLRNFLIFLPVAITWFGISKAIAAYSDFIQLHQQQNTEPFILLWQQGFDKHLPASQYLSSIAWDDFLVVFVIVLLTIAASYLSSFARIKREQETRDLAQQITHALAGASLCLTTRNWQQPTNFVTRFDSVIETFKTVVAELVVQIQDERVALGRLADRQREETELFSTFRTDFINGMGSMALSIDRLQDSTTTLATNVSSMGTAVDSLIGPSQQIADQQPELIRSARETTVLLRTQVETQEVVVRQQEQWGQNLRTVLTTLETTLGQNADHTTEFADRIRELFQKYVEYLEEMKVEHGAQKDITDSVFETATQMKEIVRQILSSGNELSAINVNLQEIDRRVASITGNQR